MRRILAECVATAETTEYLYEPLFREEAAASVRFSSARLAEFRTGRACARRAMVALGHVSTPIPKGKSGEPVWPDDLVGSITHCHGYRAAAVALKSDFWTIGIDAEPHHALPDGVASMVTTPCERALLDDSAARSPGLQWYTILFCIKEAVYKAWFHVEQTWLDFDQVLVDIDESGTFRVALLRPWMLGNARSESLDGRWVVEDEVIKAAVAVRRTRDRDR